MKRLIILISFLFLIGLAAQGFAEEQKIILVHPLNAQFELFSPQGTRILIDIANEGMLSSPATEKDILLTTHGHTDHVCGLFNVHKGPRLQAAGELRVNDVAIQCIPSAHVPGDVMTDTKSTNFLFIIEIAGLRIAHFGDIGQNELTPNQLKALGRVDVALMQLANDFSIMDIVNLKAFNLMDQVKPKLVITTHNNIDCAKYGAKIWEGYYLDGVKINLSSKDLEGNKTKLLFMGDGSRAYGKVTKVPVWPGN